MVATMAFFHVCFVTASLPVLQSGTGPTETIRSLFVAFKEEEIKLVFDSYKRECPSGKSKDFCPGV